DGPNVPAGLAYVATILLDVSFDHRKERFQFAPAPLPLTGPDLPDVCLRPLCPFRGQMIEHFGDADGVNQVIANFHRRWRKLFPWHYAVAHRGSATSPPAGCGLLHHLAQVAMSLRRFSKRSPRR